MKIKNSFRRWLQGSGIWVLKIERNSLNQIANGQKIVEGRVPDPQNPQKEYSAIKPGEIIHFVPVYERNWLFRNIKYRCIPLAQPLIIRASYIKEYPSVEAMLQNEGLDKVLPGCKSIKEGIELYHNFPGCQEKIAKNGIVAIGLDMKAKRIVHWSDIELDMEEINKKWINNLTGGCIWPRQPDKNLISCLCSPGLSRKLINAGEKKLSEKEKNWKGFIDGLKAGYLELARSVNVLPKERGLAELGDTLRWIEAEKKKKKEIVKKVKFPY